jgi:hypothetical protein
MADPRGIRTRADWTRELQALFARPGLSYHVLAERCGTSTSTLQEMVTGKSFPRPSTVRLFVQACGEHDAQPWVDARARVREADATLRRHRTPPARQIRIGAVPQPADCFQEREVSDRLERAAEDGGTVVLTQVLAGMGGVGKTQLAAAYARRVWAEGVGVLVWVNAATRDAAAGGPGQAVPLPRIWNGGHQPGNGWFSLIDRGSARPRPPGGPAGTCPECRARWWRTGAPGRTCRCRGCRW